MLKNILNNQKGIILYFEIFIIIFFIWFTFFGGSLVGPHLAKGFFISEDGHNFITSAELFRDNGFNIFIKSELSRQASISYIFTIILIFALMEVFNDWYLIFVGINLTLFFLSYFFLKNFLIKKIAYQEKYFFLNIILIFIYFSNYENYFYTRFILSDCFFSFFTLLLFLNLNSGRRSNINNLFIFFIAILIFFINPKFIAILFYLIFYFLIKLLIIKNRLIDKKNLGISLIFFYLFGQLLWAILYVNYDFINYLKGDIF